MSHQSSLLSSNTAGYDWPDFSSFSNLHPNALMCVHKLVRVGVMEDEEGISSVSCLLCFPCCLVLHRGHFKIVPSAWRMLSPIVCGFEGRCWESRSSCSHHSGQFSWINRDLLTRKHKQVDWSESGHENIYCCRWNAENAAVLNMKRECCHDISLSFYHHHHHRHHHFELVMSDLKTWGESYCECKLSNAT